MKPSDLFRRAARNLPPKAVVAMDSQILIELNRNRRRIDCSPSPSRVAQYARLHWLEENVFRILYKHKPKGLSKKSFWVRIANVNKVSKNTIVVSSVEEAQAKRKEILLKCAEIAESEGL